LVDLNKTAEATEITEITETNEEIQIVKKEVINLE